MIQDKLSPEGRKVGDGGVEKKEESCEYEKNRNAEERARIIGCSKALVEKG